MGLVSNVNYYIKIVKGYGKEKSIFVRFTILLVFNFISPRPVLFKKGKARKKKKENKGLYNSSVTSYQEVLDWTNSVSVIHNPFSTLPLHH